MIKTCDEIDSLWKRDTHVYRTTPRSFCSNFCANPKPYQFKCSKEIMPNIRYSFGNKEETTSCDVKSSNGIDNERNQECLRKVQKFLLEHESKTPKVIYITHGWQDDGAFMDEVSYNLFKKYGNDHLVVAKVYWKTGANASKKRTLSSYSHKNYPLCKTRSCRFAQCCTNPTTYGESSVNTWPVGNVIAYVHKEITAKLKIKTYCMGFSLGAHVCGFFGKMTRSLNNDTPIHKIIGLDPAGPIFEAPGHDPELRLNRNDAETVEILHTNTVLLGYEDAIGHIDLYINGGSLQPNCPKWQKIIGITIKGLPDSCSHGFAVRVLNHVLNNDNKSCYSKWQCVQKEGAYYSIIKQERFMKDELQRVGCNETSSEHYEVGKLDFTPHKHFGVFWIQIDDNSDTCRMII